MNVNEVTSGNAGTYAKMFSALQAGNAPDLGQVEYATLPNFEHVGGLVDLSKYGADSVKSDFVPSTWAQVSQGSAVYAFPQDIGPMGLFYRADLFKKYGLTVPTTWAQYLSDAQKVHAANPNAYIAAFPANDAQWFSALAWQAGAQWFSTSGDTWVSASTTPLRPGRQLLAGVDQRSPGEGGTGLRHGVVQGPVRRHLAHLADRRLGREHPDHQRRLHQGRLAGGGDAQLGPAQSNGDWGGSTTVVFKDSKYPAQAASSPSG